MAVDYDLVVIGNSPEGIYAAVHAAHLNARVALVEQPLAHGASEAVYHRTLAHTAQFWQSRHASEGEKPELPSTAQVKFWAEAVNSNLSQANSPAVLAAQGVDVVSGAGEFCRLPEPAFVVKNRRLRSRTYLIATGSSPAIPNLVQTLDYLTTADLFSKDDLDSLPQHLVIVGGEPLGVELAQSLKRLGKEVTLVVKQQILPYEDREASQLIQAQLEAEGVKVLTNSPIVQVKQIEAKKWLQAGHRAIEADEIVLTASKPNLQGMNLEGVGVKFGQRGLLLNQKLQTTNPRIYACGAVAGGYQFAHIAQYEAKIALKNALFVPLFKVDYRSLPWVISTDPQLGRVGLTEAQAKRRYKDVLVVREYFKEISEAQIRDKTTGFCKLMLLPDGEIVGAQIVGPDAGEYIGTIAIAMNHNIKVGHLAHAYPASTLAEIIGKTATRWQRDRLTRHQSRRNLLETFFIWRRKTR